MRPPHDPVVISGDSVMWSRANMDAVAAAEGTFLGPIARGPKVVEWVCAAEPTIEVAVSLQRQKEPVRYLACVAGRFAVNGVADAGTRLVIHGPRRAQQEARDLEGPRDENRPGWPQQSGRSDAVKKFLAALHFSVDTQNEGI